MTKETKQIPAPEVCAATMLGDLMKIVIDQVKAIQKPWEELSEGEQANYLDSIEFQCKRLINAAVDIIASDNMVTLTGEIDKVVFKDGVTATLKIGKGDPAVLDLAQAQGQMVKIVVLDTEQYEADGSTMPEADQDQPGLELDTD